jgi:hypothetical protein
MSCRSGLAIAAVLVAASLVAAPALAQTCAGLSAYLDDLRANYRRLDKDIDLEATRETVKAIRTELTDTATAALDCRCMSAYTELLNSASFARAAEGAADEAGMRYQLNRSILSYNTAVDLLNHCPR